MKIKKKNIHRGALLQQYVADSGMNVTQVCKKAGFSRSSYYNHITDPNLPVDILLKYGKILHHDFIKDFPEILGNIVQESSDSYTALSKAETLEEAIRQRDIWKEKYFELLEKYHILKEQMEQGE